MLCHCASPLMRKTPDNLPGNRSFRALDTWISDQTFPSKYPRILRRHQDIPWCPLWSSDTLRYFAGEVRWFTRHFGAFPTKKTPFEGRAQPCLTIEGYPFCGRTHVDSEAPSSLRNRPVEFNSSIPMAMIWWTAGDLGSVQKIHSRRHYNQVCGRGVTWRG